MPGPEDSLAEAWHGNDTTWRMVMDLNQIVIYGKNDGQLADQPQRTFYSLCDGIVGGQGDGPLKPDPLALGVVSFTNDSAWNDICMSHLMGLDIKKIPLLGAARKFSPFTETVIRYNGEPIEPSSLKAFACAAIPPPGWVTYMKV